MKAEMILKLLEAGYTKSDISLMEELEPLQAPATAEDLPTAAPAEDPAPAAEGSAEDQKPLQQADDVSNVSNALKTLTETVNALAKSVEAMQKKNAQQAESEPPKRCNTADALQDFFGKAKKA